MAQSKIRTSMKLPGVGGWSIVQWQRAILNVVLDKDIDQNNEVSNVNKAFHVETSPSSDKGISDMGDPFSYGSHCALTIWKGSLDTLQLFTASTEQGALLLQSPTDKDLRIEMTRERFNFRYCITKSIIHAIIIRPLHIAILSKSLLTSKDIRLVTQADNVKGIIHEPRLSSFANGYSIVGTFKEDNYRVLLVPIHFPDPKP